MRKAAILSCCLGLVTVAGMLAVVAGVESQAPKRGPLRARALHDERPLRPALAQATGSEFGVRSRLVPRVEATLTYWWLNLSSELVFNADSGSVEPSGASHRQGLEFSLKAKLFDWLTFTGNVTSTNAQFANGDAVPIAP